MPDHFSDMVCLLATHDGMCTGHEVVDRSPIPCGREELAGVYLPAFLHPGEPAELRAAMERALSSGEQVSVTVHHPGLGRTLHITVTAPDPERLLLLVRGYDRREQVLRESVSAMGRRLRGIINGLPAGMHVWHLRETGELVLVEANPAADDILGFAHDAMLGAELHEVFPEAFDMDLDSIFRRIAQDGDAYDSLLFHRPNGDGVQSLEINAFQSSPGETTAFFTDITQRLDAAQREKTYRDRLRLLAERLATAEDAERRRLAENLHDGVSQTLAVCRIYLRQAQAACGEHCPDQGDTIRAMHLLDAVIKETRNLTTELFPPVLAELGLLPAIRWLCEESSHNCGLPCHVDILLDADPQVGEQKSLVLFRAARELLTNARKHASASSTRLRLYGTADDVVLTVEDDGCGFAATEAVDRAEVGFGLFSIRERVDLLGGTLEIQSLLTGGSAVTVRVPIDSEPTQEGEPSAARAEVWE